MKTITDIKKLNEICQNHQVEYLYLFGSVLTKQFHQGSDVDFLVSFKEMDLAQYFSNFIDLKQKLEELVGRKVDLVESQTLRNPILIKSIKQNLSIIYQN